MNVELLVGIGIMNVILLIRSRTLCTDNLLTQVVIVNVVGQSQQICVVLRLNTGNLGSLDTPIVSLRNEYQTGQRSRDGNVQRTVDSLYATEEHSFIVLNSLD